MIRTTAVAAQLARFVAAGGVGTLVNALVFLTLRTWWDLLPANLTALVVSTLVSTEVNRRFTFSGEQGHRWRAHVQTVGMVAFYAVYSSGVLLGLHAVLDAPTPLIESGAVAAASVLGGAGRFLLLRFWVFDTEPDTGPDTGPDTEPGTDTGGPTWRERLTRRWRGRRRRTSPVPLACAGGGGLVLSSAGPCDGPPQSPDAPAQTGY